MEKSGKFVTWETTEGEPITVGERTLTPQAQALGIRWPGGGFVWNRPTGLRVSDGARTEFLAITDVTRTAVWVLLAIAALALAAMSIAGIRQRFVVHWESPG